MSLSHEYAYALSQLTGDDFQAEVCVRLGNAILSFQDVPRKPHGDGGLDGLSHSAENVIVAARRELAEAGYGTRAQLHVGDIREWLPRSEVRFDLVMLLNNIYYFDRARRQEIYRQLGTSLTDSGQLLLVRLVPNC